MDAINAHSMRIQPMRIQCASVSGIVWTGLNLRETEYIHIYILMAVTSAFLSLQGSFAYAIADQLINMRFEWCRASLGLADPAPPNSKKAKSKSHHHGRILGDELDRESYDRHVKELSKVRRSGKKGEVASKSLMQETYANTRRWIVEDRPSVVEVIETFPLLEQHLYVSI